jgi:hypothetical protein
MSFDSKFTNMKKRESTDTCISAEYALQEMEHCSCVTDSYGQILTLRLLCRDPLG